MQKLKIRDVEIEHPIIQGGMGIGISSYKLAGNVSKEGALGVLSSAALDRLVSKRYDKPLKTREACSLEVEDAKKISGKRPVGINIMVAIQKDYADSVHGAMDADVDFIISGAGLPLNLPEIARKHSRADKTALIPIASSGRALELICRRWSKNGRVPDAVIVEGPKAGGHIAWKSKTDAFSESNSLEALVEDVKPVAEKYGNIPVIAAGGVYDKKDIEGFLDLGCSGVQMGTRFLATKESGATEEFKQKILECKEEDIVLADKPGSPCRMLFRVLKQSPFYEEALNDLRKKKCDKGYLQYINSQCVACQDTTEAFCICNGLLAACGYNNTEEKELYSVGSSAFKIDKLLSVSELIKELTN